MRECYLDLPGLEIFSVHVRVTMTSGWAGTLINAGVQLHVLCQLARLRASASSVRYVGDGSIAKLLLQQWTTDSVMVGHPSITFKSR